MEKTVGDILLSGARAFDAAHPGPSRSEANAELWVLRPGSGKPPVALGAKCKEGPSVSRTRLQIAWAVNQGLDVADIVYDASGTPRFAHRHTVLREAELPEPGTMVEAQDFRPGAEHELIINLYTKRDNTLSSTFGFDLRTRKLTDYSKLPDRYSEPEGIFPDGRHTLVESSRHAHNYKGQKNYTGIDLYVLALDGSGATERLTYFNDDPAFKASPGRHLARRPLPGFPDFQDHRRDRLWLRHHGHGRARVPRRPRPSAARYANPTTIEPSPFHPRDAGRGPPQALFSSPGARGSGNDQPACRRGFEPFP